MSAVSALFRTASKRSRFYATLELVPAAVLREIAAQLACGDVLRLGLTSRLMWDRCLGYLYEDVDLKTNRHCKMLAALARRPKVLRSIKRLAVRPNNVEWTLPEDEMNEGTFAELIHSRVAPNLASLHTFIWDGLQKPPCDELWLQLRRSCPRLTRIGTTIGAVEQLENGSHLFDFRGLHSFSLVVKCASLAWLTDGRPKIENLPRRLWEMLIENSPDLAQLTIGGAAPCPRPFDVRPIAYGRWPRLRSLTLGDLIMQHEPTKKDATIPPSLRAFLLAHPRLRAVNFQHIAGVGFPRTLASLPDTALPHIRTFSGPLLYVKTLPQPWRLRHLTLNGLQHSQSAFPKLFAVLRALTALESLSILFDLSLYTNVTRSLNPQDHTSVFCGLLRACPRLVHLDLLCFTQPTFGVCEFSAALILAPAPHLRSFVLTKVQAPMDDDMGYTAMQLAHTHPHLTNFTLRYTQDSWLTPTGARPKYVGTYVVRGNPGEGQTSTRTIEGHERGGGAKTFGFGGQYSRRWWAPISSDMKTPPSRRPSLLRKKSSASVAYFSARAPAHQPDIFPNTQSRIDREK
ncbi:hypothetical protein MKEN_00262100 [Mycena kentingensis (nom. inval.)]|nr:hypothetical protein MKEN_00262100 [Mycena kentingensis (nom. inval.)]